MRSHVTEACIVGSLAQEVSLPQRIYSCSSMLEQPVAVDKD